VGARGRHSGPPVNGRVPPLIRPSAMLTP
jgi:hypothetical protein